MDEEGSEEDFPGRLLHQAALWGNAELLEDLLHGDELQLLDSIDALGRTALHAAATNENETCSRILLQAGADPNIRCGLKELQKTPLHVAAESGHLSIVQLLLAHQSDLFARDGGGLTALDVAEKAGHAEVMAILRKAADEKEEERKEVYHALWDACSKGEVSSARKILVQLGKDAELVVNTAPKGCSTLLFKSCEDGQKDVVKLLLEFGADGRTHPVTRYSPLYISCYYGRKEITDVLLKRFPELIQVATVEKWLPLHAATMNGHIQVLDLLLTFPYPTHLIKTFRDKTNTWEFCLAFDINAQDVTEQTVLYMACYLANHRIVDLLTKFKVKATRVQLKDEHGETGFNNKERDGFGLTSGRKLSVGLQSIMSKLSLKTNEKDATRNETDLCPLDLDLYCNQGAETALHVAVRNKHYRIASLLLQNGADPNLSIKSTEDDFGLEESPVGSTALVEACKNRDTTIIDLLIRYGARDDDCKALCVAARNGDESVASKLLTLKAHPDPEFKINKKALDISPQMVGRGTTSTLTYSALFPTTPVMINWHGQHCLQSLHEQWLMEASIAHNIKLKLSSQNQTMALAAITRLDVSNNEICDLPNCLFHMPSLKILNLAQNKIERLPEFDPPRARATTPPSALDDQQNQCWSCTVLEEIHLQDNRLDSVPDFLFCLPSLVLLDLSNNKLQSISVKMWSSPKLRELNLSLNLLHDLPFMPYINSSPSKEGIVSEASSHLVEGVKDISCISNTLSCTTDAFSLDGNEESFFGGSRQQQNLGANLKCQELHHHNFWSRSIDVVESLPNESWNKELKCQLTTLNLAHNAYKVVPPSLACCCPNLARLNLSYNHLEAMGHVGAYPANLKHLDISHNRIASWLTLYQSGELSPSFCYNQGDVASAGLSPASKKSLTRPSSRLGSTTSATSTTSTTSPSYCSHKKHCRLDNLRTLILADNELDRLTLTLEWEILQDEDDEERFTADSGESDKGSSCSGVRSRNIFPNLSMLDVSNNHISEIPLAISELSNLSVLNVSGNYAVATLPPQMGLLGKLWNLNMRGCGLGEPLKGMMDCKKYKTMDIIGYLKSVLENAKPYARMKLMIVGVQGIGKTSLLEQLRQEGSGTYRKKPPEHWAKRMGNKNMNLKTAKGVSMSTVGVDVGDWTYEKKIRGQSSHGPVTFRTWDFGGQREYYATHQYFLSKRSLYLVVWRITDGERGVNSILQWLVNIQARAPNAPVLVVGTHYDMVKERFPSAYSEDLQQMIRERFINVVDADKCGLPRVLDTIEVSCRTRHNMKLLCNLIYDTVFSLVCPGSKERFLEQKIPATYLALEDVVGYLVLERRIQGKDPVLRAEQYKMLVMHEMQHRFNIAFRDMAELNQATTFLHENGILLHYEDATLKDLYFLDPQWLCDMLAHVVTIREINPFARNGVMKIEDLKHVFKSSQCAPNEAQMYILNLLNKFEVALSWDSRTLLIPSLLATEDQLRAGLAGCDVRVPVRSRSWALRGKNYNVNPKGSVCSNVNISPGGRPQSLSTDSISSPTVTDPLLCENASSVSPEQPKYFLSHVCSYERSVFRLLLMSYFPSGFWSRLMTRILADGSVVEVVRSFFNCPRQAQTDPVFAEALNRHAEWICWQTGMELRYLDCTLFRIKEVLPQLGNHPCDYTHASFLIRQEGVWTDLDIAGSSLLEIYLPYQEVVLQHSGQRKVLPVTLRPNHEFTAKLISLAVNHIDTLLEDWYPTLGTRFVHTSEGRFLVTRLVPCTQCLTTHMRSEPIGIFPSSLGSEDAWQIVDMVNRGFAGMEPRISKSLSVGTVKNRHRGSRESTASHDSGVGPDSNSSSRKTSAEGALEATGHNTQSEESRVYSFLVEECILAAYEQHTLKCPSHGDQLLSNITPDVVFLDLGERYMIRPDNIKRGKMLGRGAFGFVFKATVKQRGSNVLSDVAMKMLQPVDPGFGARQSDTVAYKAAWNKWQRDPLQYACKAYCTARQELDILLVLRHPSIVPLVGICSKPLSLVLQLAPQGALDTVLRNYRRSGARLDFFVLQKIILQIARALEYLHQQHIIYRDLKSENVLVWQLPPPFHAPRPHPPVDVKLADYGISRSTLPTGTKGFGGTEGFMAPEIMRFNGEEEYTEKVDCFSFGMFIYELVTLHLPFEGQECVKDHILEGGRPSVTNREMQYPTYVLDLMTLCWSQQPKDRPSASQIVSIATAHEFVHLVDVVSLQEQTVVLSATALRVNTQEGWEEESSSWEVWLSRLGEQVVVMSCSDHKWQEYKTLRMESISVTSLCVVEDSLWLGDSRGSIHVSSCGERGIEYHIKKTYQLDPDAGAPMAVRSMAYSPSLGAVTLTTSTGRLWLCDTSCENAREIGGNGNPVFCIALVSFEESYQMWCGQTQGSISIFTLAKPNVVTSQEIVYHYNPAVDNMDVTQLVSGTHDGPTVWSYIYPGCVVYQWDVASKEILHKLDCSKLAPCSESLISISIEEHLSPGRCQVTALTVCGAELYVGTTWGCIIVAEGATMRPITIFRPFEEEVKAILPLAQLSSSSPPLLATVGKGYRNLIGRYAALPSTDESFSSSMFLILWQADAWSGT